MTKAALYRPVLFFERGFWRLRPAPVPWSEQRAKDRQRRVQAQQHVAKLNRSDEAQALRDAHYKRLSAQRRLERQRST